MKTYYFLMNCLNDRSLLNYCILQVDCNSLSCYLFMKKLILNLITRARYYDVKIFFQIQYLHYVHKLGKLKRKICIENIIKTWNHNIQASVIRWIKIFLYFLLYLFLLIFFKTHKICFNIDLIIRRITLYTRHNYYVNVTILVKQRYYFSSLFTVFYSWNTILSFGCLQC